MKLLPGIETNKIAYRRSTDDVEIVGSVMSLLHLRVGMKGVIARIDGGRGACKRLNELGLIPGTQIEMVNNIHNGPVMIKVKGSKLAIGRGLAKKVLIVFE